jgi:hypothetical protein
MEFLSKTLFGSALGVVLLASFCVPMVGCGGGDGAQQPTEFATPPAEEPPLHDNMGNTKTPVIPS